MLLLYVNVSIAPFQGCSSKLWKLGIKRTTRHSNALEIGKPKSNLPQDAGNKHADADAKVDVEVLVVLLPSHSRSNRELPQATLGS